MDKIKFQEQMQIAIAMWNLETCHSVCRRSSAAGRTIDEINVWTKELFYFIDDPDFEWACKNLKGQPEEMEHLTEVRNFFQSLKEMGFKYGEDFTMEPNQGLVVSDKLRATVDKFIKIGNQFNTVSNYQQENLIFSKTLDFLLPLSHDSSSTNTSSSNIEVSRDSKQHFSQTRYASVGSQTSTSKLSNPQKSSSTIQDTTNLMDAVYIYNLGLDNFNAKNYKEALDNFKQAMKLDPSGNYIPPILAYINRGKSYLNLGYYNEALKDLERARDIAYRTKPYEYVTGIHWDLGITHYKAGNYEAAIYNLIVPAKVFSLNGNEKDYTMVCITLQGLKMMILNCQIMADYDKSSLDKIIKSINAVVPPVKTINLLDGTVRWDN